MLSEDIGTGRATTILTVASSMCNPQEAMAGHKANPRPVLLRQPYDVLDGRPTGVGSLVWERPMLH